MMTIEEMQKHEWSVSWSGGKDSTATILLMHEHNIPIKEIIYVRMMYDDTLPATLPIMTEFVDKATKVFEEWGYEVKIIKSLQSAKQIMDSIYQRSKFEYVNGRRKGLIPFLRGMCQFTGIKTRTINSIQMNSPYEMIGYACDETSRLHRLTETKQSIMVTLGIKEDDTYEICRKYNLLSPLYDLGIKRDGCFFCPNCAKREREFLQREYPDYLNLIIDEIRNTPYVDKIYNRNSWVKWYYDYCRQMSFDDLIKENYTGE